MGGGAGLGTTVAPGIQGRRSRAVDPGSGIQGQGSRVRDRELRIRVGEPARPGIHDRRSRFWGGQFEAKSEGRPRSARGEPTEKQPFRKAHRFSFSRVTMKV